MQTVATYRITGNVYVYTCKETCPFPFPTTFKLAIVNPLLVTPVKKRFALAVAGGAAIIVFAIVKLFFALNG